MIKKPSIKRLIMILILVVIVGGGVYATELWKYVYDSDKDGHVDAFDMFPIDPTEWYDMDGDGYGDNRDEFPKNAKEHIDSDGDHFGDNEDVFPKDPTEHIDSDGDGYGDNKDAYPTDSSKWKKDSDGDGYPDDEDDFPNNPSEHKDSDGDHFGDNEDEFPYDSSEHIDSDGDGWGDSIDAFPDDPTEHLDSDGDGRGDNKDAYPYDSSKWSGDSDGDGLSDEEEQEIGTSVYNPDTDGDTVPDGMDEHPLGGDRHITKEFKWSYGGYKWTWDFSIPSDVFDYYNIIDRPTHPGTSYVTYNDPTIKSLANRLEIVAEENGFSKAEFATAFVQNLPYLKDTYTRYDEYPKYPIQTLVDGSGDCEDSSYLAAALIAAMDIDVVLIHPEGHLAIGVWCDGCYGTYWEKGGRKYYYLETTSPYWSLGNYPPDLPDTAKLYSVFNRF